LPKSSNPLNTSDEFKPDKKFIKEIEKETTTTIGWQGTGPVATIQKRKRELSRRA
jgi:hypothetical protein